MRVRCGLFAGALLVLLGVTVTEAKKAGKGKTETSHYSGSSVPSKIDTNDDGVTAIFSVGRGKIGKGRNLPKQYTFESVYEYLPPLTVNVNCPAGTQEYPVISGHTVNHDVDADNLYGTNSSGFSCFDPGTGSGVFAFTDTIIGGTGKFAGATGTVTNNGTYTFLTCDSSGRCYSAFEGDNQVSLCTPDGKGDCPAPYGASLNPPPSKSLALLSFMGAATLLLPVGLRPTSI
jgi:hypothetical protein